MKISLLLFAVSVLTLLCLARAASIEKQQQQQQQDRKVKEEEEEEVEQVLARRRSSGSDKISPSKKSEQVKVVEEEALKLGLPDPHTPTRLRAGSRRRGRWAAEHTPTGSEPNASSEQQQQQSSNNSAANNTSIGSSAQVLQAADVSELSLFDAFHYGYFRHSTEVSVILTLAYSIVFIVGIIGNSFVVAIVCKSPRMRTVTNYFIVNLAFADILVLVLCLPATLMGNLFIPYVLGLFVCKTVSYLQGVAVSASINTMVAVTMDRFLAICFPMDWHMSRRNARWTIACIWLFSLFISLPWALYFSLVPYPHAAHMINVCAEVYPSVEFDHYYFVFANLILLYLLPATLIILCYLGIWYKIERRSIPGDRPNGLKIELILQKSKLKVVKMMMVVVIIFLLSWLPLYLIFFRLKFADERSQWEEWLINTTMPLAQWLGASNSCINPILYTFFNRKYKQGFSDLLRLCFCCGSRRSSSAAAAAVGGANGEARDTNGGLGANLANALEFQPTSASLWKAKLARDSNQRATLNGGMEAEAEAGAQVGVGVGFEGGESLSKVVRIKEKAAAHQSQSWRQIQMQSIQMKQSFEANDSLANNTSQHEHKSHKTQPEASNLHSSDASAACGSKAQQASEQQTNNNNNNSEQLEQLDGSRNQKRRQHENHQHQRRQRHHGHHHHHHHHHHRCHHHKRKSESACNSVKQQDSASTTSTQINNSNDAKVRPPATLTAINMHTSESSEPRCSLLEFNNNSSTKAAAALDTEEKKQQQQQQQRNGKCCRLRTTNQQQQQQQQTSGGCKARVKRTCQAATNFVDFGQTTNGSSSKALEGEKRLCQSSGNLRTECCSEGEKFVGGSSKSKRLSEDTASKLNFAANDDDDDKSCNRQQQSDSKSKLARFRDSCGKLCPRRRHHRQHQHPHPHSHHHHHNHHNHHHHHQHHQQQQQQQQSISQQQNGGHNQSHKHKHDDSHSHHHHQQQQQQQKRNHERNRCEQHEQQQQKQKQSEQDASLLNAQAKLVFEAANKVGRTKRVELRACRKHSLCCSFCSLVPPFNGLEQPKARQQDDDEQAAGSTNNNNNNNSSTQAKRCEDGKLNRANCESVGRTHFTNIQYRDTSSSNNNNNNNNKQLAHDEWKKESQLVELEGGEKSRQRVRRAVFCGAKKRSLKSNSTSTTTRDTESTDLTVLSSTTAAAAANWKEDKSCCCSSSLVLNQQQQEQQEKESVEQKAPTRMRSSTCGSATNSQLACLLELSACHKRISIDRSTGSCSLASSSLCCPNHDELLDNGDSTIEQSSEHHQQSTIGAKLDHAAAAADGNIVSHSTNDDSMSKQSELKSNTNNNNNNKHSLLLETTNQQQQQQQQRAHQNHHHHQYKSKSDPNSFDTTTTMSFGEQTFDSSSDSGSSTSSRSSSSSGSGSGGESNINNTLNSVVGANKVTKHDPALATSNARDQLNTDANRETTHLPAASEKLDLIKGANNSNSSGIISATSFATNTCDMKNEDSTGNVSCSSAQERSKKYNDFRANHANIRQLAVRDNIPNVGFIDHQCEQKMEPNESQTIREKKSKDKNSPKTHKQQQQQHQLVSGSGINELKLSQSNNNNNNNDVDSSSYNEAIGLGAQLAAAAAASVHQARPETVIIHSNPITH